MKQRNKLLLSIFLVVTMIMGNAVGVFATDHTIRKQALNNTANYICKTVKYPQVGSIGGEWVILGLARSGCDVPKSYFDNYYTQVEKYVKECNGVLHEKKYTDYSRLILALTAIGYDPRNVAGYNLLTPLGDYEKTIWQGINGPVWALIALDSKNYPMPENKKAAVQATREKYIEEILARQLSDGGFSLTGGTDDAQLMDLTADPDITGMVLQALAKYQDKAKVKEATEKALLCLSKMQDNDGGYDSWGESNSESVVQVIVALTELGISLDDERFIKNGNTLQDNLMSYHKNNKGFQHTKKDSNINQMATEQGFYALVSIQRAIDGKNSLYRMNDVKAFTEEVNKDKKDSNVNKEVKIKEILFEGKTFKDIKDHKNQEAIEALAERGIINGKTKDNFVPDATMSRAEFATIMVEALGLKDNSDINFEDVKKNQWFYDYVASAYKNGIVSGTSEKTFNPNGTITKEEAACMIARAAKICGMDTTIDTLSKRDVLSQFTDYVEVSDWASDAYAFCYQKNIIDQSAIEISPKTSVKRCEIAEMLYRMLNASELL
ncbi:MAG: S-layer homology domain-containing protein [Anaerovorax sp.]|nr:S-layer homology domain-containing protein [Anaerovorax sp.]